MSKSQVIIPNLIGAVVSISIAIMFLLNIKDMRPMYSEDPTMHMLLVFLSIAMVLIYIAGTFIFATIIFKGLRDYTSDKLK